jgi:hypothetical protein
VFKVSPFITSIEKCEDTERITRNRTSKDKQYNGTQKHEKTQMTNDRAINPTKYPEVNPFINYM